MGFLCRGYVRVCSGAAYFPYLYVDKALALVNDAYESRLCKLGECMHQSLEEGGVVCPRGGVGFGVLDLSSGSSLLDLWSCGGESLSEVALCLLEDGAGVADGDGHELHFAPHRFESVDERGLLGDLLLESLMASEVSAEFDLCENEVAFLAVKSARVHRRGV